MTFQEKSALTLTVILALVFGWYFTLVLGPVADSPAREIAWKGLLIPVAGAVTVLAAVSHIVLAIVFRRQPGADGSAGDERDRLIGRRAGVVGGYVLAVGVWAGIALLIAGAPAFWTAQALIGALVLAELTDGLTKIVLYRRG